MALCFLLSLLLTGCNTEKDTTEKDLQRLSMIEVYSSDGELVNVIEDTDILYQFNNLDYTDNEFTNTKFISYNRKILHTDL